MQWLGYQLLINVLLLGRHAIVVTPEADNNAKYLTPPSTSTTKETLKGILRMFTVFPYWDVSYLVAVVFTIGSVVWCINAFFVWLPLVDPASEFPGEISDAGGWSAWVGASIFEFGSVLLMIEAVNENRADCFGWAVEEVLEEQGLIRLKPHGCVHHHKNKGNLVGKGKASEGRPYSSLPYQMRLFSSVKLNWMICMEASGQQSIAFPHPRLDLLSQALTIGTAGC